jgi:hypothetical protein
MSLSYDPTEGDEDFIEAVDEGDPAGGLTVEEQARARGWIAPGEPGAPRNAYSAEEYLARGMANPAMLRADNSRLARQVNELTRQVGQLQETQAVTQAEHLEQLRQLRALVAGGQNREIDRERARLETERRGAIEAGDATAFDQIEAQIATLKPIETPPPPAPPPPPGLPPAEKAVIDAFTAANPWFFSDPILKQGMMDRHTIVRRERPAMPLADQLELARRRLAADFPDKFAPLDPGDGDTELANDPQRRPPQNTVLRPGAGSTQQRPPAGRRTVWDEIPTEERQTARDAYQTNLRSDPDQPESEFVALWLDPHLDYLELRRKRKK